MLPAAATSTNKIKFKSFIILLAILFYCSNCSFRWIVRKEYCSRWPSGRTEKNSHFNIESMREVR